MFVRDDSRHGWQTFGGNHVTRDCHRFGVLTKNLGRELGSAVIARHTQLRREGLLPIVRPASAASRFPEDARVLEADHPGADRVVASVAVAPPSHCLNV